MLMLSQKGEREHQRGGRLVDKLEVVRIIMLDLKNLSRDFEILANRLAILEEALKKEEVK
jgi:hypothetical protein